MTSIRITIATALVAATLAGCMTVPAAEGTPDAGGTAYMALGTEPFWALEITPAQLNFTGLDSVRVALPNPGARPSVNGERYVTRRMTVDVTHAQCSDGMSELSYADTVTVNLDGRRLSGCGGNILPPPTLDRTDWRILTIEGTAAAGGRDARMSFAEGRMSGSAGCNRLNATYAATADRLTLGPIMATRMACPAPLMTQEQRLTAILANPVGVRFNSRGQMLLSNATGVVVVLERLN